MGWMIKFFAMYVAVKQERGRLIRWIYNNHYKQDSGQDSYNMFTGRSEVINDQPESVYFMDKFIQPTHLFLHSNPLDYPETAKAKGIKSSKEWEQTVVTYEAFRAPKFALSHLRKLYEEGKFDISVNRTDFKGTDEEYEEQLPGQFMDKWVSELQTTNLVRFIDEFNTPNAKLP